MSTWSPRIKRAVTNWLALPEDVLLDVSRVTCVDGRELVIENVSSLVHVGSSQVRLQMADMVIDIAGADFEVTLVAGKEVHVRGTVHQVTYVRSPGGHAR